MAVIVDFPQANTVFNGEDCLPLPALRCLDLEDRPLVVSCWQLTPEELEEFNKNGGKVFLYTWCINPQPAFVGTVAPEDPEPLIHLN